jgi:hypothetical protein
MAFEVMMGEDIVLIASHKIQTAHGTPLPDADFETTVGRRLRVNSATMGDVSIARSPGTPRPGSQTEHSIADNERVVGHDSALSLSMDCESWMLGMALSHIFQVDGSQQEGSYTHYTHTMTCSLPLAQSGTRVSPITSVYLDSGSLDAGRLQRVLPDLAITGVTLSGRGKDIVSLGVDMVGSGVEVTNATITVPALPTDVKYANDAFKLELGARNGSLTDISERLDAWSMRFNKSLALEQGYYPGSGLYRKRLWFLRRTFSLEFGIYANRANRDLIDDMVNRTRKEIKITIDTGVLAGTSPAATHKFVARYPDVRIGEAPLQFNPEGAMYGVRVAEDQIYLDPDETSPVTVTIDNTTPAYLVPQS